MRKKQEVAEILEKTKLFAGVPREQIEVLLSQNTGGLKKYRKGELLISAGDNPEAISVVISGTVLVNRFAKDGTELVVHVLKERKTIGIEFVQNPQYRSYYNYIAQTDVTVYSIPQSIFTENTFVQNEIEKQLLFNMVGLLSHENLRQAQKMFILSMGSIRRKMMAFLFYEYQKTNSREFDISFNRESLAAYLCVNRSALSREIGLMEKEGLFTTKGKHFTVSDQIVQMNLKL